MSNPALTALRSHVSGSGADPITQRLPFTVLWYSGGPEHAPNRVIGRTIIGAYDLSTAIETAARWMARGKLPRRLSDDHKSSAAMAHGFYVRSSTQAEADRGADWIAPTRS